MCPGIGMGTSPCEQSFMDALQVCYEYESDFRGNKHFQAVEKITQSVQLSTEVWLQD